MNSAWTKGLVKGSQEEKDVRAAFKEAVVLRKRLTQMLQAEYEAEAAKRLNPDEYDSPGWSHKQADAVGYSRALKNILKYLAEK